MTTTVSEPSSSSTANNDVLLSFLQAAIPTICSITILDSIVQANAQGCRVSATHHGHSSENHHYLFVKRVLASDNVHSKTSWNDFQRTLLYGRTEARFYNEILPLLVAKGFSVNNVPTCHVANCNLDGLVDDVHVAWQNNNNNDSTTRAMPSREDTANKGCVLVLDSMHDYYQESPLTMNQAKQCLKAVAHLHAAAWQETNLLVHAQQQMARGSYHLSTRNPKELQEMQQSWHHFVQEFSDVDPLFFGQSNIQCLGSRMYEMAEYISEQLTPSPTDAYATLCHGDFKAMNVFLPNDDPNKSAVMIDFASTGVGMGMSDVAMHVIHAVVPTKDDDDYESKLVDAYLEALQQARVQYNTNAVLYPREVAMRHFRLACIDYIRFVIGRFWKTATKESFEKKKDSMNTTLVNRDINAAMAWIAKVDNYLVEFVAEKEAAAAKDE